MLGRGASLAEVGAAAAYAAPDRARTETATALNITGGAAVDGRRAPTSAPGGRRGAPHRR